MRGPALYTLARFRKNPDKSNQHKLITLTLGKLGIINQEWEPDATSRRPAPEETWLCRLDRETQIGHRTGAIVLTPIKFVPRKEIRTLKPDTFAIVLDAGMQLIIPHSDEFYWRISPEYKAKIDRNIAHSTVVLQALKVA